MLQAFQSLHGSLRAANGLSKVWKMLKPRRLPRLEMLRFLDLSFGGSTAGKPIYIFKPQQRIKHKIQLVSFSFHVRRQSCVLFWNKFPFDYFLIHLAAHSNLNLNSRGGRSRLHPAGQLDDFVRFPEDERSCFFCLPHESVPPPINKIEEQSCTMLHSKMTPGFSIYCIFEFLASIQEGLFQKGRWDSLFCTSWDSCSLQGRGSYTGTGWASWALNWVKRQF